MQHIRKLCGMYAGVLREREVFRDVCHLSLEMVHTTTAFACEQCADLTLAKLLGDPG